MGHLSLSSECLKQHNNLNNILSTLSLTKSLSKWTSHLEKILLAQHHQNEHPLGNGSGGNVPS